ncbi:MAG: hypothetical protein U5R06_12805 [candidate division KSB1 bacterium]|nr:hypothetical protein [candidate division KSB1 bacterium]
MINKTIKWEVTMISVCPELKSNGVFLLFSILLVTLIQPSHTEPLAEITGTINLHETLAGNKFALWEIAEDDSTRLAKFIDAQDIPYPNALASDDILQRYGITAFPTTLLIGPDGSIIGKDLRGPRVTEKVKEKMLPFAKHK